jgi:hypothetical protein
MVAIFKSKSNVAYFKKPSIIFQFFPKPLTGLTPRSLMGSKWWKKEKQDAILENNYCCHACGVNVNDAEIHKRLEAFPIYIRYGNDSRVVYRRCAALCHLCYCVANFKMSMNLFEKDFMDSEKFDRICAHRNEMMVCAHFDGKNDLPILNWDDWFLEIEGQFYFSKFKNEKECDDFYLTNQQKGDTNGN